jgi:hypothetical protein
MLNISNHYRDLPARAEGLWSGGTVARILRRKFLVGNCSPNGRLPGSLYIAAQIFSMLLAAGIRLIGRQYLERPARKPFFGTSLAGS